MRMKTGADHPWPGAAGYDALPVLAAHDECALLEAGDHADTGGLLKDSAGNAAVFGGHDLVEDGFGGLNALLQILAAGGSENWRGEGEQADG